MGGSSNLGQTADKDSPRQGCPGVPRYLTLSSLHVLHKSSNGWTYHTNFAKLVTKRKPGGTYYVYAVSFSGLASRTPCSRER